MSWMHRRTCDGWDAYWRHIVHEALFILLLAAMLGWFLGRTVYNEIQWNKYQTTKQEAQ